VNQNEIAEKPPSNTGHGHVFPRPDGVRFRCGGPGRCAACNEDALRKLTTAGQAQESYEGVIDCRTCVHLGTLKDCTAPFGCAGGSGFERRSALQLWGRAHG
jgi:hypothetical protein